MSSGIICDKCKKSMYADSRSDKDAYASMSVHYTDGDSTYHLCKSCHKKFIIDFLKSCPADEYNDAYGIRDDEVHNCDTCKHNPPSKKWPCIDCDTRVPADRWESPDSENQDEVPIISKKRFDEMFNKMINVSWQYAEDCPKYKGILLSGMQKVLDVANEVYEDLRKAGKLR